jgi:hypothetical protein
MGELSIFQQPNTAVSTSRREPSALGKLLAPETMLRRIATNTNGTFKRMINGEQIGDAVRGSLNIIIVDALAKVSRVYYKGKYDPNAKPTLPDCWSNLGDRPESTAENRQAASCAECPMNVKGSGENGGRACRYQRRLAVLVEGDPTGEVYQFNVPAKSLFGTGSGNVHPFESYVKFLAANQESPDTVVTNVSYDLNADSMELQFTPVRQIDDAEYALVQAAQADPATKRYVQLTVAQADGATKAATSKAAEAPVVKETPKPAITYASEPDDDDEAPAEPVKRSAKAAAPAVTETKSDLSAVINAWGDED